VVITPPGYLDPANASLRYPVLFMQDGNNCLASDPFGHGGWQIDAVSRGLIERGTMAPTLLVLIPNSASRREEYVPGAGSPGGPSAQGYLDFVAKDVMSVVETNYRARRDPASRGIGGSSFGALISFYAAWTRPDLFGFVLAMSVGHAFDLGVLVRSTPVKPLLRIYLDSGSTGHHGSDDGMQRTAQLRDNLIAAGFVAGVDLLHQVGQGDGHNEEAWRRRLPQALAFLLPP